MIPLFKVHISPKAVENAVSVLTSSYVGQGLWVEEFENKLQRYLSLPTRPLTVCSGTAGLDLIWHLLDLHPGDEVISTPMTCTATNTNLITRGIKILWADIDPYTGLIDPNSVKSRLTKNTKAIIAVDWAGRTCDYKTLKSFGIPVVEDAAHAFMASGIGGDYIMWSFQAIKHLTTVDGGAILVPPAQYARARLLRWYGLDRTKTDSFRCSQSITEAGYKYHMNDLCAAIGVGNLPLTRSLISLYRAHADYYRSALHDAPNIILPPSNPDSSWWLYCILVENPAEFMQFMKSREIETSPVHARNDKHPAFSPSGDPLPGVDYYSSHEVAIPVGWWLTVKDCKTIVEAIKEWSLKSTTLTLPSTFFNRGGSGMSAAPSSPPS